MTLEESFITAYANECRARGGENWQQLPWSEKQLLFALVELKGFQFAEGNISPTKFKRLCKAARAALSE